MRVVGLVLLAGLIGTAGAAPDLLESYRQALAGDPQLAAAEARLRAERERLAQARALFLPQVALEAGVRHVWQDMSPGGSVDYSAHSYGVGVVQPLFRKESFALSGQAGLIVEQAELNQAMAQQDLGLRLARAYFRVLQADDGLQSFEAELAAISSQLQRSRRAFEIGTATVADVNDAQARFDLVQAQRLRALNETRLAREALRRLTGQPVAGLARLTAEFAPEVPVPADAGTWAAEAERSNLQVRLAQRGYELAGEEIVRQRAQHYPRVDLVARYGRQDGVYMLGQELDITEGSIGLQLQLPLYAGGAVSSRVRQAQAGKDAAMEQVREAVRAAGLAAESAYLQLDFSLQQARALEQALKSIGINEQSTQRGVELGLRTTLDLLDIQRERFAAERDLAAARYAYLLNYMELQVAVGGAVGAEAIQVVNRFLVP
jgi:outer membrane protein